MLVGCGDGTTFPRPDMSGIRGGCRVQYIPGFRKPVSDLPPSSELVELEELQLSNFTLQSNAKNFALRAVASDLKGTIVAVGDADGADALIYRSLDAGVTWAEEANPKNVRLNAVAYSPTLDMFLAAGNGDGVDAYIVTSTAGGAWTERAPAVAKNVAINAVCWASGLAMFVLVGAADGSDAYMLTSANGTTLTERSNPQNITLRGVAYSPKLNRLVAVGFTDVGGGGAPFVAYVVYSDNGLSWSLANVSGESSDNSLLAVVWAEFAFVAVGQASAATNYMIRSENGQDFTKKANPFTSDLNAIATSGVLLVARGVTDNTPMISSRDWGLTWRIYDSDASGGADTNGLCWDGKRYVAVGAALGSQALIVTSLGR
jgi:hypothetical protein